MIEILKKKFQNFFVFWPFRPSSRKPPSAGNNNIPPFFALRVFSVATLETPTFPVDWR